jgi:hypothetical protein
VELHTTRSWDFMGLNLHTQMEQSSQMHLKFGGDVIVGVLDTGMHMFLSLQCYKTCIFSK